MDAGGGTRAVVTWASLPLDLLLEVFRRLESTAVIRCAATCRPWRQAIIDNASTLRPRPDRFNPNLLLGVFHVYGESNNQYTYLRCTPGPFQSALVAALPTGGAAAGESRIQSLIPANTGDFNREMFTDLLSSRDGFILLRGRQWWSGFYLLCNTITGDSNIIPDTTIGSCTYILLTGYDDLSVTSHQDLQAVWILAVAGTEEMCIEENRITYQVFSFASSGGGDAAGAWGAVTRSMHLKTGLRVPLYYPCTVVSGDAVYWLAGLKNHGCEITCTVALDVRTGRTWTTELAKETHIAGANLLTPTLLATSGDGRLSLIRSPSPRSTGRGQQVQVWVLMDDDNWSLQKTIDVPVHKLLPDYRHEYLKYKVVHLDAFCPRSGSVIGSFAGQEIRIDLEGISETCVELISILEGFCCDKYNVWTLKSRECFDCNNTYEMDWSTYISKMKPI